MGSPKSMRCTDRTRTRTLARRGEPTPHLEFDRSRSRWYLLYRQKRIVLNSRAATVRPPRLDLVEAWINRILFNNRIDYHAAGSYDVCRFNTRM